VTEEKRSNAHRWRLAGLLAALLLVVGAAVWMTWPQSGGKPDYGPAVRREERPSPVDEATRRRIDLWLSDRHLNPYGDPPGTEYTGGTPLFNEKTGERKDRYEYILAKHPELNPAPEGKKHP